MLRRIVDDSVLCKPTSRPLLWCCLRICNAVAVHCVIRNLLCQAEFISYWKAAWIIKYIASEVSNRITRVNSNAFTHSCFIGISTPRCFAARKRHITLPVLGAAPRGLLFTSKNKSELIVSPLGVHKVLGDRNGCGPIHRCIGKLDDTTLARVVINLANFYAVLLN